MLSAGLEPAKFPPVDRRFGTNSSLIHLLTVTTRAMGNKSIDLLSIGCKPIILPMN